MQFSTVSHSTVESESRQRCVLFSLICLPAILFLSLVSMFSRMLSGKVDRAVCRKMPKRSGGSALLNCLNNFMVLSPGLFNRSKLNGRRAWSVSVRLLASIISLTSSTELSGAIGMSLTTGRFCIPTLNYSQTGLVC